MLGQLTKSVLKHCKFKYSVMLQFIPGLRCRRGYLAALLLGLAAGAVFFSETLRCAFVPCDRIISIKGPDSFGNIAPGMVPFLIALYLICDQLFVYLCLLCLKSKVHVNIAFG